jgi:hypothetical protein
MKKLFFTILMCAGISASAQNLHFDTIANYSYINVSKIIEGGVINRRLCVKLVSDNLSNENGSAILYWELRDNQDHSLVIMSGNIYMRGDDYENWDGGNEYCYEYVAGELYFKIDD